MINLIYVFMTMTYETEQTNIIIMKPTGQNINHFEVRAWEMPSKQINFKSTFTCGWNMIFAS